MGLTPLSPAWIVDSVVVADKLALCPHPADEGKLWICQVIDEREGWRPMMVADTRLIAAFLWCQKLRGDEVQPWPDERIARPPAERMP